MAIKSEEAKERIRLYHAQYYRDRKELLCARARKWREDNIDHVKAQAARYHKEHREECVERVRKWRIKNPEKRAEEGRRRRARKHGTKVDIRERLKPPDRCKCYICGMRIKRGETHLDHIVPLAKGGSHTQYNTTWACADCNRKKSAKHPNDFLPQLELTFDLGECSGSS